MIISIRPEIGASADIVQYNRLRYSSITIARPVLILVTDGTKVLRAGEDEWIIPAGGCVAVDEGQVFDVVNVADGPAPYRARWISFEPGMVADFASRVGHGQPFDRAFVQPAVHRGFLEVFDACSHAIAEPGSVPDEIARHRLGELLLWMDLAGARFAPRRQLGFSDRVRALFLAAPDRDWTATSVAGQLAVSEATLRRRLAAAGWSFQSLLVDVRMGIAMSLLQSTDQTMLQIASAVGYQSQSRFAIRFRARFGFAPSAIRGHVRPGSQSGVAQSNRS